MEFELMELTQPNVVLVIEVLDGRGPPPEAIAFQSMAEQEQAKPLDDEPTWEDAAWQ